MKTVVPFVKRKPVDENYSDLVKEAQRKIDLLVSLQKTVVSDPDLRKEVESLVP